MPKPTQNNGVNFIVLHFDECLKTLLPKQPLSKLVYVYPLSKWSGGLKRMSIYFAYRIFPYLKFKVNASLQQILGVSHLLFMKKSEGFVSYWGK